MAPNSKTKKSGQLSVFQKEIKCFKIVIETAVQSSKRRETQIESHPKSFQYPLINYFDLELDNTSDLYLLLQ